MSGRGSDRDGKSTRCLSQSQRNSQIDLSRLMSWTTIEEEWAMLSFLRTLLKRGWNVTVSSSHQYDHVQQHKKDCESDKSSSSVRVVSNPFEVTVTDENCRAVTRFDRPFNLSVFGTARSDVVGNACMGYSEDEGKTWKCDRFEAGLEQTGTQSVYMWYTTSDHLTSFAVLLGSEEAGSTDSCGDWGWIEIASLVLIASLAFLGAFFVDYFLSFAFV